MCNGYGYTPRLHFLLVAAALILLGIFIITTVILACTTISYRKQVKELRDPERRRLLEDGQQPQGYTR
ncbi:hypothetical protein OESDEN_24910 [Oesophagostomum dentatum]|uniref:Uncharacterized protein n=1 Tax=Oesophagostomum dentatum TaxID=61180 RepID=A0A0B1RS58_OESDE|nr:hypothetical protein OESDEN_24910 [Oesophagostomum dentatum]